MNGMGRKWRRTDRVSVRILVGDVRDKLRELPDASVDCVVTSPPYWGLRDYGVPGQIGMERTLGEHIETLIDVFREVRRIIKPRACVWLNYGDCYATTPNGRSAADTKAAGNDDRTFRDKPFSTIGPVYVNSQRNADRRGNHSTLDGARPPDSPGRIVAGGNLKAKDLCLIPFRLAIALQEDGWWIRSRCIWGKPNGMPDSSGRYRPSTAHEEIFLLSKSGDLDYDFEAVKKPIGDYAMKMPDNWDTGPGGHGNHHRNGREKGKTDKQAGHSRRHAGFNDRWDESERTGDASDTRLLRTYEPEVWHIATAAFGEAHFATFPPALVERCLIAGAKSGQTVLDPFGGAGTVGLVADRMGMDAILIELNPKYAAIAERRINGDAPMFTDVSVA